jgi:hypothetical protein
MGRITKKSKPAITPPAGVSDWRAEAEACGRAAFEAATAEPESTPEPLGRGAAHNGTSRKHRAVTPGHHFRAFRLVLRKRGVAHGALRMPKQRGGAPLGKASAPGS